MELRKIVYLDDVNHNLISMQKRFADIYDIYPVQSMDVLFESLKDSKPDLILLDINMPDVSGFDVIKMIKDDARYADIPVIFLSSQKNKKSIIKGIGLGAVDYIVKPFTNEYFIDCVEYHLDPKKRAADKPIVLSVDDNPSILLAVSSLLGDEYTVYTMSEVINESMLIELLKKVTPDLFLLDYNMPALNGFDLIPIIRNFPVHEETPIIFLTSDGTADRVSAAVKLGACDYIVKPIDKAKLLEKISAYSVDYIMRRRIRALNEDK
jgi:putative two-component system response regulator